MVFRLVTAAVLGGLIGLERQRRNHPAGLRTHILVAVGSALLMIISEDLALQYLDRTNADPARIAAQVVSGIGFLGAGTIMREGLTVRGLTTAASLWVVAALGMAAGGGYYIPALVASIISLLTLGYVNRLEHTFLDKGHLGRLHVYMEDRPGQLSQVMTELGRLDVNVRSIQVQQTEPGDYLSLELLVQLSRNGRPEDVTAAIMSLEGIHSLEYEPAHRYG